MRFPDILNLTARLGALEPALHTVLCTHTHTHTHTTYAHKHTFAAINRQLTGNQTALFVKFHSSSHELIEELAIDSAPLSERAI